MNFKHKILALSYPTIKIYAHAKRHLEKTISGSLRVLPCQDIVSYDYKYLFVSFLLGGVDLIYKKDRQEPRGLYD